MTESNHRQRERERVSARAGLQTRLLARATASRDCLSPLQCRPRCNPPPSAHSLLLFSFSPLPPSSSWPDWADWHGASRRLLNLALLVCCVAFVLLLISKVSCDTPQCH